MPPQLSALLGLAVTIGLVLARPRIGSIYRVGPALAAVAGVVILLSGGLVGRADLLSTAGLMWRPLVAIASIMVSTAVAQRAGLMEWLAASIESWGHHRPARTFALVYALAALTAATLNNDAAILLLTPIVVALVRRRYLEPTRLHEPFVFAVFMAAGVAPLVVSNPMNMIVAAYAGISFNQYAIRMVPIALAGWIVGFPVLYVLFRREIREAKPRPEAALVRRIPPTTAQLRALLLVLVVLVAYPIVAYAGGPVWIVAASGAVLALLLGHHHGLGTVTSLLRKGVSLEILGFLVAVSLLGVGLRNAGVIHHLALIYAHGSVRIGLVSALGSALVNNHPMSIINMLALHETPGAGTREALAALIGGDLGPRLSPMGSLAGLLWFEALRRLDIVISPLRFAVIGCIVTIPTIAVSLGVLYLLPR